MRGKSDSWSFGRRRLPGCEKIEHGSNAEKREKDYTKSLVAAGENVVMKVKVLVVCFTQA